MKVLRLVSGAARQMIERPGEAILTARMAGWVCFLSVAVKLLPLPNALGLLSADTRNLTQRAEGTENKLAATIDRLLKTELLCFEPVCWKRAAVLHRYLALNGIATQIVFGMRKDESGAMHGHAWLECKGQPILESVTPDYAVTYTFPSADKFALELGLLND